ncbi:septal ring lytic transglycosylase RlpA family protein [Lysobacter auxotrophicus]|uniref:Endolytic peptidoglycan transglycosylase RlpA n=1 Tax=Lysobacter auxotrophicus TaxID=2992573 RepID=A0ABM8D9Q1_9GAMM|nr:septal ring lytic transglycosylase RlpA family protein [Lysobacter auxotrophicus]BDU15282.1 septal ring lytic transglycosylase RlpA family protein [Lysobacter auxotrophicus]
MIRLAAPRAVAARTLLAAAVLTLAACASSPKKSASQPVAAPDRGGVHHAPLPGAKKKSPYAPAKEDPSTRGHYTAGGLYKPGVKDSTPDYIPDVDAIPEPDVTNEPRSAIGNRPSYVVLGKTYKVLDNPKGYVERGTASYYGQKFHGRRTSNLEVYDMYAFTAAHKTLPLPSFARVTNLDNGKSVVVRVNDRGPFHDGRVIDLSYAAAVKLGITGRGTGNVEVRALTPDDDAPVYAATPAPAAVASAPAPAPAKAPSAMDRLVAAIPLGAANAAELPPGVRIATGKPAPVANPSGKFAQAVVAASAAKPPVVPTPLPTVEIGGENVVFQVASFSARANADRALTRLRAAGIDGAQISDASSNGQTVWRLRVGPLQATQATELAQRIAGLGFGQPQRVRD